MDQKLSKGFGEPELKKLRELYNIPYLVDDIKRRSM
jgi:hypothetical protein